MQNTRDQYLQESQNRYLKFLLKEEAQEKKVRDRVLEEKTLVKEKKKARKPLTNVATLAVKEYPENTSLTMDRYLTTKFRVYNIIVDSSFRDINSYPNANDFVVKLQDNLKNIVALRILRTEYFQPSASTNYFVFNNIRVPIQAYTMENAYLYLNGYISTNVANDTNTQFFGRIGPGTEIYPAINGNITQDPYIYIFQPMEQKLRRFHIKLLQADGTAYPTESSARVVITLAAYCLQY